MSSYVCAVDLGTTAVKTAIIGLDGKIAAIDRDDLTDTALSASFFDAEDYTQRALQSLSRVVIESAVSPNAINGIAISSQRATLVPMDHYHQPSHHALSWQDTECTASANAWYQDVGAEHFQRLTGLPVSALWSVSKWVHYRQQGLIGHETKFALLHDYVLDRLGSEDLYTDPSNASVTGLMNTHTQDWDDELLNAAGLHRDIMPRLLPSGSSAGSLSTEVADRCGLLRGTPLYVGGGDQQCAALAAGAIGDGSAALCLGTAAVFSCPTRHTVLPDHGEFFTTAHVVPQTWVIEGIHNTYGSAFQWASNMLGIDDEDAFVATALQAPPGSGKVRFYPFLAGIGSPNFQGDACGQWAGLSLDTARAELARAVLEGMAFEARRILDAVRNYHDVSEIHVVGAPRRNDFGAQLLADVLGVDTVVSDIQEASIMGAAALAAAAGDIHGGLQNIATAFSNTETRKIHPSEQALPYEDFYQSYAAGVQAVVGLSGSTTQGGQPA